MVESHQLKVTAATLVLLVLFFFFLILIDARNAVLKVCVNSFKFKMLSQLKNLYKVNKTCL